MGKIEGFLAGVERGREDAAFVSLAEEVQRIRLFFVPASLIPPWGVRPIGALDAGSPDRPATLGKGRTMSLRAEFRHPELFQPLAWREYLRGERFPSGGDGFVVEDVDLLVRWWGRNFQLDNDGTFALVEVKYDATGVRPARLPYAQARTFELLDGILRRGDPGGTRYRGYYLIQYGPEAWAECRRFRVNGQAVSQAGVDDFFLRRLDVEPLFAPH